MNAIYDTFRQSVTSAPDTIQFARDRRYEHSWVIPGGASRPSPERIGQYLAGERFEKLIVEYIWNAEKDNARFVLTLFLDGRCRIRDPEEFIQGCFDLFFDYPGFDRLVSRMDENIIGRDYLFRYPIEAVTIGIFNHWMSVGPLDLWHRGEEYDKTAVAARLAGRPEILRSRKNYQGLLFAFNLSGKYPGPYYGMKTPCCRRDGISWKADFDLIDHWMKTLITKSQA